MKSGRTDANLQFLVLPFGLNEQQLVASLAEGSDAFKRVVLSRVLAKTKDKFCQIGVGGQTQRARNIVFYRGAIGFDRIARSEGGVSWLVS